MPVNQRTALKTTVLLTGSGSDHKSPVLVRRGESLAYSVYSLHRRADFFGEDAEEFRPERWDEDLGLYQDETTKKYGYLLFNGGPRICLGSKFEFPQLSYIANNLQQWISL